MTSPRQTVAVTWSPGRSCSNSGPGSPKTTTPFQKGVPDKVASMPLDLLSVFVVLSTVAETLRRQSSHFFAVASAGHGLAAT
jgi:hypothetical protein